MFPMFQVCRSGSGDVENNDDLTVSVVSIRGAKSKPENLKLTICVNLELKFYPNSQTLLLLIAKHSRIVNDGFSLSECIKLVVFSFRSKKVI